MVGLDTTASELECEGQRPGRSRLGLGSPFRWTSAGTEAGVGEPQGGGWLEDEDRECRFDWQVGKCGIQGQASSQGQQ